MKDAIRGAGITPTAKEAAEKRHLSATSKPQRLKPRLILRHLRRE